MKTNASVISISAEKKKPDVIPAVEEPIEKKEIDISEPISPIVPTVEKRNKNKKNYKNYMNFYKKDESK